MQNKLNEPVNLAQEECVDGFFQASLSHLARRLGCQGVPSRHGPVMRHALRHPLPILAETAYRNAGPEHITARHWLRLSGQYREPTTTLGSLTAEQFSHCHGFRHSGLLDAPPWGTVKLIGGANQRTPH
ncbi:MAG: hypothetical protein KatS3mg111_3200 [Pirellulaceae bacterium]|nr:MAG: hypothetical protein KatS3mg111_3200 [Pirellulaceae bacterium]